ncbi:PqqD family peptide modification chaperone [Paenibacillus soyae]|uniref:PqqD family peptide modification chaperone n=1 Tax=Paenibacillus soyae TaxID=2969249 RepID=A0A9X2MLI0_9BACL|nr:PqqD family peptide modification chaperone [Paenibacillus soyae]MCR2802530.1 PqqD family peptide modification chaperone [Paenibacillus soyae]
MEANRDVMMGCEPYPLCLASSLLVLRNKEVIESACTDPIRGIALLNTTLDKCYELGYPGSRIWELVQEPATVGYVVDRLMEEYDVDRMTCESQVFSFFAKLSEEQLIRFGI